MTAPCGLVPFAPEYRKCSEKYTVRWHYNTPQHKRLFELTTSLNQTLHMLRDDPPPLWSPDDMRVVEG
jgi:hypothetical protein